MSLSAQRIPGFLSLTRRQNESLRLGRDIHYGVKSLEQGKALISFYMPKKYQDYAIRNNRDITFNKIGNGILTAVIYDGESVFLAPDIEIMVNKITSSKASINTKAPETLSLTRNEIESDREALVRAYNFALRISSTKFQSYAS